MKFDMGEVQITFPIGSWVIVTDSLFYGGVRFQDLRGTVEMHDAGSGVCVKLFVTQFFEPRLWFNPRRLLVCSDVKVLPPSVELLERALGDRRSDYSGVAGKLVHGTLQAWLIAKARARPGQGVYEAARKASWNDCVTMFREVNDQPLLRWLQANDTRVKRAQLIEEEFDLTQVSAAVIRRPKIS